MSRKRFDDMPCSIARTLDLVGDWWTLLIVREAFLGVRRFADFHDHLGIAKNILSVRLQRLVTEGILAKEPKAAPERGHEYRLTEKGRDLWAVLTALRLWGDKWIYGVGREPVMFRDRDRESVVTQLLPADAEGTPLDPRRLVAVPGPGTTPEMVKRYASGRRAGRDAGATARARASADADADAGRRAARGSRTRASRDPGARAGK